MRWLLILCVACRSVTSAGELLVEGDTVMTQARPTGAPANSGTGELLVLALDGVSRDLLYGLVKDGKLPNLARLIGDHADLDDRLLTGLPSTTLPAWVSTFSGAPPAETGVVNNEYFVRETKTFAAPAPVTFVDQASTGDVYTHHTVNDAVLVPSVYERIHAKDPAALIWVAMNHFFRGADAMFFAGRKALLGSAVDLAKEGTTTEAKVRSRAPFAALDEGAIKAVISHLGSGAAPDVLVVYLAGADLYAHVAAAGPDAARTEYLIEVVDPALGPLVDKLAARGMLADRWVMVIADHGHTEVVRDAAHAIDTGADDAPGVMKAAGWALRPFKLEVADDDPYNAVLAYGGAWGFVYLADRTRCDGKHACAWDAPPQYRDVLAVAEAFRVNDETGAVAPGMRGALDLILVREPRPVAERDRPFEVYVGNGKTEHLDAYLAAHPHPTYVDFARRLDELAVGTHGERAGDVLLLAHNGDRDKPEDRFYFAKPFKSWHGSPSKQDSEIPLIVAHPKKTAAEIRAIVGEVLGDRPYQRKVADLMVRLRAVR